MLTVITGPMFSGKSSELISLLEANVIAGNDIGVYKPSNDTRYHSEHIMTHSGKKIEAQCIPIDKPQYIWANLPSSHKRVIGIDEAQFFDSIRLIECIETLLFHRETIIVSGLSQDTFGKPFGAMPHLLAIADDIIHKKAVCSKSKKIGIATRTYRKDKSNTDQVAIGGAEMYEPRSFEEWMNG